MTTNDYVMEHLKKSDEDIKAGRTRNIDKFIADFEVEEYEKALKELNATPENFARKLREKMWGNKTVDNIYEELK